MCLDGGKLHIDRANTEAYDLFIECYAEDLLNGIPHYIVEKNATAVFSTDNKTRGFDDTDPIVNFFCELDIQRLGTDNLFGNPYPLRPLATCFVTADEWKAAGPTPLDSLKESASVRKDFVRTVVGIMFGVIARSYCDQHVPLSDEVRDALECIVADHHGEAKGDSWQAGLHLHFPKIRLRLSSIAILIHAMSHALQQHMPVGNRENAWTDRLDKSPYRCGSGLRLVGSYKAKPCPACGPKTGAKKGSASAHSRAMKPPVVCETCFGVQFVHINRRYMPWMKLRFNEPGGVGDPRRITTSRQDAINRSIIVDEVPVGLGAAANQTTMNLKTMTEWVRQCSTKVGIRYGATDVHPKGFVGDSTYALIPAQVTPMRTTLKGKAMKVARPTATTSDTEYVVAQEPMMKPPTGLKNIGIIPDTTAESAVSELVLKIPSLFDVSHWDSLEVRGFKYFSKSRTTTKLSNNAFGEDNVYIIINVKGQGMRFCTNKAGHHSKNVIYFEVHTAKTVEENLLSSMSCLSSSQDKLRTSKRIAFVVQRCYSAKKNASGSCRTYSKCVQYPLSIEERIFPPHVKAMVAHNSDIDDGHPNASTLRSNMNNPKIDLKRTLPDSSPNMMSQQTLSPRNNFSVSSSSVLQPLSSQMSNDSIDSSLSQFSSTQESTISRKRVNRGTSTQAEMVAIALLARNAKPLKE